jgi:hypothetical protein
MSEETCCPVCFEQFTHADLPYDDAMRCKNGHRVCLKCVGQWAAPITVCSTSLQRAPLFVPIVEG